MLLAIDEFMATASDPRLAWVTVSVVLDLTSIRVLSLTEIASQMGVSPAALRCATAKFREMVGLESGGAGEFRRPCDSDRSSAVECGVQRLNSRDWPTSPGGLPIPIK